MCCAQRRNNNKKYTKSFKWTIMFQDSNEDSSQKEGKQMDVYA